MRHHLTLLILLVTTSVSAQNADIDLLKQINPAQPNSAFWRAESKSAYPVAFLVHGGLMTYDYFHDKANRGKLFRHAAEKLVVLALTEGIKLAVDRPRPYIKYPLDVHPYDNSETGLSFPSAHTSVAFNAATTLAMRFNKWYITVPAFAWAGCVGYSRMYLGEHYPSDVIAGAAIGVGSAFLVRWIDKKLSARKHS